MKPGTIIKWTPTYIIDEVTNKEVLNEKDWSFIGVVGEESGDIINVELAYQVQDGEISAVSQAKRFYAAELGPSNESIKVLRTPDSDDDISTTIKWLQRAQLEEPV